MPNISFDFTTKNYFHNTEESRENSKNYTYKDIGTENIRLVKNNITQKSTIYDHNTYNVDLNAIKASLSNILSFRTGDAILEPEFGIGDIYELLYTPFDKHTTEKMLKTVKDVLTTWEPRIQILSIPTTYNEDKNEYCITINYYVPSLDTQDSYVLYLNQ